MQKPIIITNSAAIENGRNYFNKVNNEKMRVKLLDDKGLPVCLNGGDVSFLLVLETTT